MDEDKHDDDDTEMTAEEQERFDLIDMPLINIVTNFYAEHHHSTFTKLSKVAARADFNANFESKAEANDHLTYLQGIRDALFENQYFETVFKIDFFFSGIGVEQSYIN